MTIWAIFIKFSQVFVLLPILVAYRHRKEWTTPFKIMFGFLVLSLLSEIQSSISIQIWKNNMPGQHVFMVLEFLAFSAIYYLHVKENNPARSLIVVNAIVFIVIAVVETIHDGLLETSVWAHGYSATTMIVYALCYYYYLFNIDDTHYLKDYPMFWICTGVLIYFAINSPLFWGKAELMNSNIGIVWFAQFIHGVFNIVAYCFYAQSFRCLRKQIALV